MHLRKIERQALSEESEPKKEINTELLYYRMY